MSCALISTLTTPDLLMKGEFDLASKPQPEGHGASCTGATAGHEPAHTRLTNVLPTAIPKVQESPQVASASPAITSASIHTSTPMSSSMSVASAPAGTATSTASSSYTMNGDSKSMLATGTPVLSHSGSSFSTGTNGLNASGTSSPTKTPQPRWVGAPNVHSHSSMGTAESLNLPTSKFQYGNTMLPGLPQQPMFDYSHLPQQPQSQGHRPWDPTTTTGSPHGSHAQQASPGLHGRLGGGLGGPSAGGPGGALRAFGTTSDFFTPRGLDPSSGMLGGVPGGIPGAPGAGPSTMAGATSSSLLHPLPQQMTQVDPYCYPALQQPLSPPVRIPKKGKNHKKADGKQPTFLTKLYDLLDRQEYHHIIRWDEAGEMIIIERPDELAEKILPMVYRQSRFASFSRQLNIYGWMRKVSLRHVESGIHDPDASTWSHPFLRRSSTKEDILGFKRRVPPRPSQAQKNAQRIAAEMNSSDSDSFVGPPSAADPYAGLLGGLDENKPVSVFQFGHGHENIKLPKCIPTRAPFETITRTNFGPEPTAPTQGPSLPEPYPLAFAIDRKDSCSSRRYSMPTNLSRSGIPEGRPILKDLKDISMTNSFAPSSAPATAGTFSMHSVSSFGPSSRAGSDVSAGSVASLASTTFSPNASMANLGIEDQYAIEEDDFLRGSAEQPQYRVDDVSSWSRRGMGLLGQGMRPSPPMQFYSFVDPKMTNYVGSVSFGAGSVPGMLPTGMQIPGGMHVSMNPSMGNMMGPNVVPMTINVGGVDEKGQPATPPSTVSPGVYQKGFNLPWSSPKEGVVTGGVSAAGVGRSSPALSSKKERRQSLTSPYSTSSPPRGHTGVVRGVGGNNKRDSLLNIPLGSMPGLGQPGPSQQQAQPGQTGTATAGHTGASHSGGTTDDEGLPSASLDRPPLFQGQLEIDAAAAHTKETSVSE